MTRAAICLAVCAICASPPRGHSDGSISPWHGATGSEAIDVEIGRSPYNHAMLSFVDRSGVGHVLVVGGADRDVAGSPSAAVLWY